MNDPSSLYMRKPTIIQAALVNTINLYHIANWCGGVVEINELYIEVPTPTGTQLAHKGEYVICMGNGKYKVLTVEEFTRVYQEVEGG